MDPSQATFGLERAWQRLTSLPARILAAGLIALLLATCAPRPSLLEQVKARGILRVVTRNSPSTFYFRRRGPTGFEYDLVRLFAASLNVKLKLYAPLSLKHVLDFVRSGRADIAAAGLTVTPERRQRLLFGPPYQFATQKLIYRLGESKPATPADLRDHSIEVIANSSHAERLSELRDQNPGIKWKTSDAVGSQELLAQVAHGELDYTVADSYEFHLTRRYYPTLRAAFTIKSPEPIAWAFRRTGDRSLYRAAVAFFARIRADGKLKQIQNRYFGVSHQFDYVGTRTFLRDIHSLLPKYRDLFAKAAENSGIDWRLLAAIGYQESHWNASAISPTGVRGVMMLTQLTAGEIGIENRIDPKQSISGGARYFAQMKQRIPASVDEPDRTWMALASYNLGLGHILDAREVTRQRGGNPDRWIDVRASLPLLAQKKWYSKTAHGYANGEQPLVYVANIRRYYSILNWMKDRPEKKVDANAQTQTATAETESDDAQNAGVTASSQARQTANTDRHSRTKPDE